MKEVTNPEKLKELNALFGNKDSDEIIGGVEITDPDKLAELNKIIEDDSFTGKFKKAIGATKDFFTGTKTTEFPEIPEIGFEPIEDKAASFKIGLGLQLQPNQKIQAQIIQSQIPDSQIFQDRFNNIIVRMPDGKNFYLNKPGASFQDFIQLTGQILSYIPGYSYAIKKAGTSLLKRGAYAGLAGGGTSVVQDIASMPLGGKDVDLTRAVVSTVVPAAFETTVNPVAGAIYRKIFGNPSFTKTITVKQDGVDVKKVVLNDKGKAAAKEAGIDVNNLTDEDFIKNFAQKLSFGTRQDVAASQAGAGKFKFQLSRSQALGDEEGIASLFEAAKGIYGKDAQITARDFLKRQEIDIETSAKNLVNRFNKGQIEYQSIEDAGQALMQGVKNVFKKKSDEVQTAYNYVDKDGIFQAQKSNVEVLKGSVRKAVDEATATVDKDLTPATVKAIDVIDNFVKKANVKKPKKKVESIVLNDLNNIKKKLNSIYKTANNKTDQKNVVTVIKEWEKFVDDNVDNILFSGNPNSLELLKKANQLFKEKEQLFGINKIKKNGFSIDDKSGKVIGKILYDPEVTPLKTIDYIFGRGTIGRLDESLSVVKKLKKIFDVTGMSAKKAAEKSPDFQALRTGFFEKLVRDSSRNGKFSPTQFVNNFKNLQLKNKDLLKELFDDDEIKLISEFVTEVQKTFKPKDLVNPSNTASALMRALNGVARQLVGILGFKTASIQGLLAARTGFDRAKDIVSAKQAEKIIGQEIAVNFAKPINPVIDIGAIISGQEILNNIRTTNAPQFPPSLLER